MTSTPSHLTHSIKGNCFEGALPTAAAWQTPVGSTSCFLLFFLFKFGNQGLALYFVLFSARTSPDLRWLSSLCSLRSSFGQASLVVGLCVILASPIVPTMADSFACHTALFAHPARKHIGEVGNVRHDCMTAGSRCGDKTNQVFTSG